MGRAYKNFWSLNTDEAIVIGILRDHTFKNIEVLMPLNAQMKDIDLVLMAIDNKKTLKIQVKGSRAYEPTKNEVLEYKEGSCGWFLFPKDIILKSTADYFIFLIYVLEEIKKTGRRIIFPHTLTIPTEDLIKLCEKYKKTGMSDKFNFFFWINPVKKIAFDYNDKDKIYYLTKYLDKKGLDKLNLYLK